MVENVIWLEVITYSLLRLCLKLLWFAPNCLLNLLTPCRRAHTFSSFAGAFYHLKKKKKKHHFTWNGCCSLCSYVLFTLFVILSDVLISILSLSAYPTSASPFKALGLCSCR